MVNHYDIVNNKTGLLHAVLPDAMVKEFFSANKWNKKLYTAVERNPKQRSKFTHEMSRMGRIVQYGPV